MLEELLSHALSDQFKELENYAKLKIRRDGFWEDETDEEGLVFSVTGRPRFDRKIMNSTIEDICFKLLYGRLGSLFVEFPVGLYFARGK